MSWSPNPQLNRSFGKEKNIYGDFSVTTTVTSLASVFAFLKEIGCEIADGVWVEGRLFNLLKPSGNFTYHQV
jgi:hypothetical protein